MLEVTWAIVQRGGIDVPSSTPGATTRTDGRYSSKYDIGQSLLIDSARGGAVADEVAKKLPNQENAVYLVSKPVQRLSQHWRRITGSNRCQSMLQEKGFAEGNLVEEVAG